MDPAESLLKEFISLLRSVYEISINKTGTTFPSPLGSIFSKIRFGGLILFISKG